MAAAEGRADAIATKVVQSLTDEQRRAFDEDLQRAKGIPDPTARRVATAEAMCAIMGPLLAEGVPAEDLPALNRATARLAVHMALSTRLALDEVERGAAADRQQIREELRRVEGDLRREIERERVADAGHDPAATTALRASVEGFRLATNRYVDAVARRVAHLEATTATTAARVEDLEAKLGAVDRAVQQNTRFIVNLGARVDAMDVRLADVEGRVVGLEGNLDFTQGLLYGSLSDRDKLAALQNPAFLKSRFSGDEGEPQRELEVARLEAKVQRDAAIAEMSRAVDAANQVYQVALNLGLEGEDQRRAAKVLTYVNAAASATKAYSSGDYLGAAVAVTSLFAKQRPSPEQQRFEAIMERLAGIDAKLDLVLENQGRILEGLRDTQILVLESERRLGLRLESINQNLVVLHRRLRETHEAVLDALERDFAIFSSILFVEAMEAPPAVPGYTTWREQFARGDVAARFWEGLRGLEELYVLKKDPEGRFDRFVHLFYYDGFGARDSASGAELGLLRDFEREAYQPAVRLLARASQLPSRSNLPVMWELLQQPLFDAAEHEDAVGRLAATDAWFGARPTDESHRLAERLLGRLLEPARVERYGRLVLAMTPYLDAVGAEGGGALLTAEEYLQAERAPDADRRRRKERAAKLLASALATVDAAVGQQALLGGHGIFPLLARRADRLLVERTLGDSDDDRQVVALLRGNALARRNVLVDRVRSSLRHTQTGLPLYDMAWHLEDTPKAAEAMQRLLPPGWRAARRSGIWMVQLTASGGGGEEVWLALPSPWEVSQPGLEPTDGLLRLLALRRRLAGELAGYHLFQGDAADERPGQVLRFLLLTRQP